VNVIEADLAFVGVSVVAMIDERVIDGQTVLIRDGTIAAVGPEDEIAFSDAATVVSGEGRYLIPGLADMHVHVTTPSELAIFVANGITLVRNMWGVPEHLEVREQIESGLMLGPRIVTAGGIVDGIPTIWPDSIGVADADSAIAEMNAQMAAGYDFIKIYSRLTAEPYRAIVERSRETGFPFGGHVPWSVTIEDAMRDGMRTIEHLSGWDQATALAGSEFETALGGGEVGGRLPAVTSFAEQLTSGEIGWDEVFDPARRDAVAALAAETGTWNVPTLVVSDGIFTSRRQAESRLDGPLIRYVQPAVLTMWDPDNHFMLADLSDADIEALHVFFEEGLARVTALHNAGAGILAGTDTPNPWVFPGFSLHRELEWFVEAGLSPYEALATATRSPAEFLGDDSFGTIEVGKRADLVLLEANPLGDISATQSIVGVSIQDQWLPRIELDALLEGVVESLTVTSEAIELPVDVLAEYQGTFESEIGRLSIRLEGESLVLESGGQVLPLAAEAMDRLFQTDLGMRFEFTRGNDNVIDGMILRAAGQEVRADKIE
jgi:imidazolonepropionase-like amidohydrolase